MQKRPGVLSLGIPFLMPFFLLCCSPSAERKPADPNSIPQKPFVSFTGKIVFQSNFDGDNELYLLSNEKLEKLTDNKWEDEFPVWSPDGSRIAFTTNPGGQYDIHIMNSDGGENIAVTSAEADDKEPAWFPDGDKLAFSRENKRLIRKSSTIYFFDLKTRREQKLIPDFKGTHGIPHISSSDPLVTFTGKRIRGWDAALYNWETREVRFLGEGGKTCRGRFSPDGGKIAFVSSRADGKGDIWTVNTDGSEEKRLTFRDDTYDYFPAWSPDGRYIVFNSSRQHNHNGDWQLYILEVSTGKADLLFDTPGNDVFPDWKE